jgi:hypothetical protein
MIYTSVIITEGSGSLGDLVFYPFRGTLCVRARVAGQQPRTERQLQVRARVSAIASAWDALTEEERDTWRSGASTETWYNSLGQPYTPKGYDVFMRRNLNRQKIGITQLMREYVELEPWPDAYATGIEIYTSLERYIIKMTGIPLPANWYLFVKTSPAQSPGRRSRRLLRETYYTDSPQLFNNIWSAYVNTWATPTPGASYGAHVELVNGVTGQSTAGQWLFAVAQE